MTTKPTFESHCDVLLIYNYAYFKYFCDDKDQEF